jgi:HTH-type transcriptional regulator/antitoxin HipB
MQIRTPHDLGHLVRAYRRAAGMSQEQLASHAGTSQRWISQLENGKPTAELGMVLRTLLAVGVDLDVPPPGEPRPDKLGTPAVKQYPDINAIVEKGRR